MSRRAAGVGLVFTAAFLYATRFISAAIFASSLTNWSADLFRSMLQYVDQGLSAASLVAFVLGAGYLLWAEIAELRRGGG